MVQSSKVWQSTETLTLSADTSSTSIDTRYLETGAYQLTWTGLVGLAGTITVQTSNDNTNWVDMESPSCDVIFTLDATTGTQMWYFTTLPWRYMRLKFTANGTSAGTGTLEFEAQRLD